MGAKLTWLGMMLAMWYVNVVGRCENVGYLDSWYNLLVVREGLEMF